MQVLWKSLGKVLKWLKIELPCDPVMSILAIYPKDTISYLRDIAHPPLLLCKLQEQENGIDVHQERNGK